MVVTDLEKKMLILLIHDDFIGDRGWEDPDASTWSQDIGCFAENYGLMKEQVPVLVGSLIKKELLYSDGEVILFTEAGRNIIREHKLYEASIETLTF